MFAIADKVIERWFDASVIARSGSGDPPSLAMRAMAGLESAEAPLRVGGSNPDFVPSWIASLSLSPGRSIRATRLAPNDEYQFGIT